MEICHSNGRNKGVELFTLLIRDHVLDSKHHLLVVVLKLSRFKAFTEASFIYFLLFLLNPFRVHGEAAGTFLSCIWVKAGDTPE